MIQFGQSPAYFNTTGPTPASPYHIRFVRPSNLLDLQSLQRYEAYLEELHKGMRQDDYDQFMDSHLGVFLLDTKSHDSYVRRLLRANITFIVRSGAELPGFRSVFVSAPGGFVVEVHLAFLSYFVNTLITFTFLFLHIQVSGFSSFLPANKWNFCGPKWFQPLRPELTQRNAAAPSAFSPDWQIWKFTLQSGAPLAAQVYINETVGTFYYHQPHAAEGANGTWYTQVGSCKRAPILTRVLVLQCQYYVGQISPGPTIDSSTRNLSDAFHSKPKKEDCKHHGLFLLDEQVWCNLTTPTNNPAG